MTRDEILEAYFEWMYNMMCHRRYAKEISFRKLFAQLHETEFRWPRSIPKDSNRASDGVDLRRRFALNGGVYDYISECLEGRPCSVLEMMIALAIRCEENITDDPFLGDRTAQWFWSMIKSLGLSSMVDYNYDEEYVNEVIERFLNRKYEPNGKGGLFTLNECSYDLRKVEIWYQLNWYLDEVLF